MRGWLLEELSSVSTNVWAISRAGEVCQIFRRLRQLGCFVILSYLILPVESSLIEPNEGRRELSEPEEGELSLVWLCGLTGFWK